MSEPTRTTPPPYRKRPDVPQWKDEHPHIAIPLPHIAVLRQYGFTDHSWRQDACPRFHSEPLDAVLMYDAEAPADRESPTWEQFRLYPLSTMPLGAAPIIETNDWDVLKETLAVRLFDRHGDRKEGDPMVALAEAVAKTFRTHIEDDLTPIQLAALKSRNAMERDPNECHSHDFLDANEYMAWALAANGVEVDTGNDAVGALWGDAWQTAKDEWKANRCESCGEAGATDYLAYHVETPKVLQRPRFCDDCAEVAFSPPGSMGAVGCGEWTRLVEVKP